MNGYGGGYDDGYGNQYGYGNNGGAYAADYGYYGNTMSYVQPDYRPGAFRDGRQPPPHAHAAAAPPRTYTDNDGIVRVDPRDRRPPNVAPALDVETATVRGISAALAMPVGWEIGFSKSKRQCYYFNNRIKARSWEPPPLARCLATSTRQGGPIPRGWVIGFSLSRECIYFINNSSGECAWDLPRMPAADLNASPALSASNERGLAPEDADAEAAAAALSASAHEFVMPVGEASWLGVERVGTDWVQERFA